jgi:hypothetical protein
MDQSPFSFDPLPYRQYLEYIHIRSLEARSALSIVKEILGPSPIVTFGPIHLFKLVLTPVLLLLLQTAEIGRAMQWVRRQIGNHRRNEEDIEWRTWSELEWCGLNGDWDFSGTWRGGADEERRPHGHGVLVWPAISRCEYSEGTMVAGRMRGQWVVKYRDGTWRSYLWKDDVYQGFEVPSSPVPPLLCPGVARSVSCDARPAGPAADRHSSQRRGKVHCLDAPDANAHCNGRCGVITATLWKAEVGMQLTASAASALKHSLLRLRAAGRVGRGCHGGERL